MADPADTGQRNPLSSSSSHASGTSALSVTVPSERAAQPAAPALEEAAPQTQFADSEAAHMADASFQSEASFEPEASSAPQAEFAVNQSDGWIDEPAMDARPDPVEDGASAQPNFAPEPDYAPSPAEAIQEAALLADAQQPMPEPEEVIVDASASAADEPSGSDAQENAPEPIAQVQHEVPAVPLTGGALPEDTGELRALARQTIAENEARQQTALEAVEQLSRRFTLALEEAGIDAARVSFKVMEFAQASMKNNLELAKAYAAARSVPDIFGLHAAYLTRQFELLNAQAEELREIAAKMTLRSAASLKPHADPADASPNP